MKSKQSMAVKQIPRLEFDRLFPDRHVLEEFTGALVECYVNETEDVLGGVDHRLEDDWSYVVMKRNRDGEFRVVNLNAKIESKADAETALFQEMEKAETE
jgi:hypothetical protein